MSIDIADRAVITTRMQNVTVHLDDSEKPPELLTEWLYVPILQDPTLLLDLQHKPEYIIELSRVMELYDKGDPAVVRCITALLLDNPEKNTEFGRDLHLESAFRVLALYMLVLKYR